MSTETAKDSISLSAARLRWAVFATMALIVGLYLASRLGLQLGGAHVEYRQHAGTGAAAQAVGAVTTGLLLLALFRLTQMLARIASGEMFSAGVTGRFRGFAFWLLAMALFSLVAPTAAALLQPVPGAHAVEIRIDFREVLTVGVTLVLFLLARLLERARRLEDEMREFV